MCTSSGSYFPVKHVRSTSNTPSPQQSAAGGPLAETCKQRFRDTAPIHAWLPHTVVNLIYCVDPAARAPPSAAFSCPLVGARLRSVRCRRLSRHLVRYGLFIKEQILLLIPAVDLTEGTVHLFSVVLLQYSLLPRVQFTYKSQNLVFSSRPAQNGGPTRGSFFALEPRVGFPFPPQEVR